MVNLDESWWLRHVSERKTLAWLLSCMGGGTSIVGINVERTLGVHIDLDKFNLGQIPSSAP